MQILSIFTAKKYVIYHLVCVTTAEACKPANSFCLNWTVVYTWTYLQYEYRILVTSPHSQSLHVVYQTLCTYHIHYVLPLLQVDTSSILSPRADFETRTLRLFSSSFGPVGGGISFSPNTIDFMYVFSNYSELVGESPVVLSVLLIVLLLYGTLILWARWMETVDQCKVCCLLVHTLLISRHCFSRHYHFINIINKIVCVIWIFTVFIGYICTPIIYILGSFGYTHIHIH